MEVEAHQKVPTTWCMMPMSGSWLELSAHLQSRTAPHAIQQPCQFSCTQAGIHFIYVN